MAEALGRLMLALLMGGIYAGNARGGEYVFHHENVMGTSLELRVTADSAEGARWAEGRVLAEADRLSGIFSGYEAGSEFSKWMKGKGAAVRVSAELYEVLEASDRWREFGGGAFDPRVEALTRLWNQGAKRRKAPTEEEIAGAKALMKAEAWKLDGLAKTATRVSDCPLSLNAIAKGYIVGKACEAAFDRGRGVRGLLLNIGGDLRACGEPGRMLGVANPFADSEGGEPLAYLEVRDRAVATSGNSQRGWRVGGRWYSHLFDPRTGRPVERVVSATVVAKRSMDADALAKVFSVLAVEESLALVKGLPDVACLLVSSDGRVNKSDGWGEFERPGAMALAMADKKEEAAADWWGAKNEVVVNFEINRPEAEAKRYRRPYVAVWVENKEGFPVRNLALWLSQGGAGPFEWVPDLTRWYRGEQARKKVHKKDMVTTISRPTRAPGKYTVIWDGKDDQGKPLPAGEYTVFIEAARERGTYQSLRQKVTVGGEAFFEELKGDVEIKSASVAYRRKSPGKPAQ